MRIVSWMALSTSRASRSTRSGLVPAADALSERNRSVAAAPDLAAVADSVVASDMVCSLAVLVFFRSPRVSDR